MYKKFLTTLIVNFIIANHVPITETQKTLYYKPISEQEAADSLVKIEVNQVLPLALVHNAVGKELRFPESLERIITNNGRIINGTQFRPEDNTQQVWFCPTKNHGEYCLEPKDFQGLEPLQCAKVPQQFVQEESEKISCGNDDARLPHGVYYELCPRAEKDYEDETVIFYAFCYDVDNDKTIFTSHVIKFPELLDSKVLRHEQNVKYDMELTTGFTPSNIQELIDAFAEEELDLADFEEDRAKKHVYKLQKMTPPEDMAFASWGKSTYSYFNSDLQHEALVPLWNEINKYIRNEAKEMYVTREAQFSIQTGVFDLDSSREDGQKSNVWVKVIYSIKGSVFDDNPQRGMVIMMNNFIDKTIKDAELPNPTKKSILDYCEDDFCENELKQKFESVGGRVRCCSLSEEIKEMFRWIDIETKLPLLYSVDHIPLLRVPGINKDVGSPSEIDQLKERSV